MVRFLEALPKTATGKVLRYRVAAEVTSSRE
jgi:acyl-coenzyme A synthetase/AMP-(fatty) acid ligase